MQCVFTFEYGSLLSFWKPVITMLALEMSFMNETFFFLFHRRKKWVWKNIRTSLQWVSIFGYYLFLYSTMDVCPSLRNRNVLLMFTLVCLHSQEGTPRPDSTSGSSILCSGVNESHSGWPANGLHPPRNVLRYPLAGVSTSTGQKTNKKKNSLAKSSLLRLWLSESVHKTQAYALIVLCHVFFFRLLPWDANVATYRFMGGDKCMYSFIKTKQQQQVVNGHVKSS